jgi:hypothetical protein
MIELAASEGTLRVHPPQKDGWCRVELETAGNIEVLGADARDKVLKRLAAGVRDVFKGSAVGMIKGIPVHAVMSLFENHCTIYAADANGMRTLFVQRADGRLAGTLSLTAEQRQQWLAVLASGITIA